MTEMTPEARKMRSAYQREWRKKNPDRVREHQRRWREKHREKLWENECKYWNRKAERAAATANETE